MNTLTIDKDIHEVTVVQKLLEELILNDGNHPSVITWDYCNLKSGVHNMEYVIPKYDIQNRPVIYSFEDSNGIGVFYYSDYETMIGK